MSPFVMHLGLSAVFEIAATVTGAQTDSAVTTHTLAFPTGSVSGDLVVFCWGHANTSTTVTPPAGWGVNATDRWATIWKVIDGSEGGSVDILTALGRRSTWTGYRVTGAHGDVEATSGTSPTELTPAWGSAANLWIAWAHTRGGDGDWTLPADYGTRLQISTDDASTSTTQCVIASGHRVLTASAETPGSWGLTGTSSGVRYGTIAVRPA